jgi:hypothetical protein
MRRALLPLLLVALLVSPACRRKRLSPEDQVRQAIDVAVKAVRERDVKTLNDAVSEQYSDRERNDKQRVIAMVRMQFVVHPNLYLVAKTSSVECPEPTVAQVLMFAALASVPSGVAPDLRQLSADVYRFDLTMADEDGTWRVVRAVWAPASVKDLL